MCQNMKCLVLASVLAALISTAPALAQQVTQPSARGFIAADRAAQRDAQWMFPRASNPLGIVTPVGCDEQAGNGGYLCSYAAELVSSGHWRGANPPATVEHWTCVGEVVVVVRRASRGGYFVKVQDDPCHPTDAGTTSAARLLFVAAIHHRQPGFGRVRRATCRQLTSAGVSWRCRAVTRRRSDVRGDVLPDGTTQLGAL